MKMLKKAVIYFLGLIGLKRVTEENEETISIDEAFAKGDFLGKRIVIDNFRCRDENLYGVICGALNITNILMLKINQYYLENPELTEVPWRQKPLRKICNSEYSFFVNPESYRICFNRRENALNFYLIDWGYEHPFFGFRLTRMTSITIWL